MVTSEYEERILSVARGHRLSFPETLDDDPVIRIENIRGILNRAVYATAQTWMMPRWVVSRSKKGDVHSEDAMFNNNYCDLALIGGVGGRFTGIADEAGLVMANPECGALDLWIHDGKDFVFPALEQDHRMELMSEDDQVFTWSYRVGAIELCRHVYHVQDGDRESIYNEIEIRNKSLTDARMTIFAVVRPMSIRGVEPITEVSFDETKNRVYTNGRVALECDRRPTTIVMATGDNPNILVDVLSMSNRWDTEFRTARGLATAVLRFDISLRSARTSTITLVQPFSDGNSDGPIVIKKKGNARYETVGKWFEFMDCTMSASFPEARLNGVFKMAKAVTAMQARGALEQESSLTDGDRSRILLALSQIGAEELVLELAPLVTDEITTYLQNQEWRRAWTLSLSLLRAGHFIRESTSELTSKHFLDSLYAEVRESMVHGESANSTQAKMTTAVESPEIEGPVPPGHESIEERPESHAVEEESLPTPKPYEAVKENSIDSLLEMKWLQCVGRELVDTLDWVGRRKEAEELYDLWKEYSSHVNELWEREFNLSREPEESKRIAQMLDIFDLVVLGNDSTGIPSRIIDESALTIRTLLMKKGLLKRPGRQEIRSNYLTLRLAQIYALRYDGDSIESLLAHVLKSASEYQNIPDEIGENESPHIRCGATVRTASDLIILIRMMTAKEQGENLITLGGFPDDWFVSPKDVAMTKIPTTLGKIDILMGTSANQHQIEFQLTDLPQEIEIHVTSYRGIMEYKVYGGSLVERVESPISPYLRVVPLSDNVVVTYHK